MYTNRVGWQKRTQHLPCAACSPIANYRLAGAVASMDKCAAETRERDSIRLCADKNARRQI